MIAVPQSGPITIRSLSRATRLSIASSDPDTLLLNSMTFSPRFSALSASAAAYSPGVEISARFASLASASAIAMLRGAIFCAVPDSACWP